MARPKKKPVKETPRAEPDQEGLLQEPEEVTETTTEEEEPEEVEPKEQEPEPEEEEAPEEEAEPEEEEEEEEVETPDFGAWFQDSMKAPAYTPPQPGFAQGRPVGPPPGGAEPELTAEALFNNPNLLRQEAARIAQQTMVPYQQALNGLMFNLRQQEHNRAMSVMQANYAKVTREEPLYRNKQFKEALDNSMGYVVQQAWYSGNTQALYNPILPRVIAFALKASAEMAGRKPRRVTVRGGEVATGKKVSGQKARPKLTPEQEALRKRLGLSYDQWVENETTSDKHKSNLDW